MHSFEHFFSFNLQWPEVMIETGAGEGKTMQWAMEKNLAKEYHTVEFIKECFDNISLKFKDVPNYFIHLNSSPNGIAEIIPTVKEKLILFWLDAHFLSTDPHQDLYTQCEHGSCPVKYELQVILDAKLINKPYILIDDASYFNRDTNYDNSWPTLKEIKEMLPDYNISIIDDVIYCLPE